MRSIVFHFPTELPYNAIRYELKCDWGLYYKCRTQQEFEQLDPHLIIQEGCLIQAIGIDDNVIANWHYEKNKWIKN